MHVAERYFDVFPRVIPADCVSVISLRPAFSNVAFPAEEKISLSLVCLSDHGGDKAVRSFHLEKGTLVAEVFFPGEQEHVLEVTIAEQPAREKSSFAHRLNGELKMRFRFYSLREDLLHLRPFKGDFHAHSHLSDGNESPEYVACRYRQEGFDFMAITDHFAYAPSLLAVDYWRDLKTGFKVFPGEEVHLPDNNAHIVNFGGNASVNCAAREDEEKYRREVAEICATLPPGENTFSDGSSEWAIRKIKEFKGLSVFCHPYWEESFGYSIPESLTDSLIKRHNFDALEVISGFYRHQWRSQAVQSVRYLHETALGNQMPVLGTSDAHCFDGGALFNWFYTLVFAPTNELGDIIEAVRSKRSLAVISNEGQFPGVIGDFRLAKYGTFLMDEYLPRHTALCRIEGDLMMEKLRGSQTASKCLENLGAPASDFREQYFLYGID